MAAGVELRSGGQHVSQTLPVQVFASPQGHAPFISAYKACTHRSYFKSDQEQYNCAIMELLPLEAAIHGQSGEHVGFPGGPVVKNLPANAGDLGSIPGWGRCPGGGNGNPLQYSCLENPVDTGAWWATVHGVSKSQTRLKWLSMHTNLSGPVVPRQLVKHYFWMCLCGCGSVSLKDPYYQQWT